MIPFLGCSGRMLDRICDWRFQPAWYSACRLCAEVVREDDRNSGEHHNYSQEPTTVTHNGIGLEEEIYKNVYDVGVEYAIVMFVFWLKLQEVFKFVLTSPHGSGVEKANDNRPKLPARQKKIWPDL
jgi:hypothetical protein